MKMLFQHLIAGLVTLALLEPAAAQQIIECGKDMKQVEGFVDIINNEAVEYLKARNEVDILKYDQSTSEQRAKMYYAKFHARHHLQAFDSFVRGIEPWIKFVRDGNCEQATSLDDIEKAIVEKYNDVHNEKGYPLADIQEDK